MTWLGLPFWTRSASLEWWSNARRAVSTYGRLVVMSRGPISTLPSCTSFGCTNLMSSSTPISFRRAAQTSPSKSLRVTSLNVSRMVPFRSLVPTTIGSELVELEARPRSAQPGAGAGRAGRWARVEHGEADESVDPPAEADAKACAAAVDGRRAAGEQPLLAPRQDLHPGPERARNRDAQDSAAMPHADAEGGRTLRRCRRSPRDSRRRARRGSELRVDAGRRNAGVRRLLPRVCVPEQPRLRVRLAQEAEAERVLAAVRVAERHHDRGVAGRGPDVRLGVARRDDRLGAGLAQRAVDRSLRACPARVGLEREQLAPAGRRVGGLTQALPVLDLVGVLVVVGDDVRERVHARAGHLAGQVLVDARLDLVRDGRDLGEPEARRGPERPARHHSRAERLEAGHGRLEEGGVLIVER